MNEEMVGFFKALASENRQQIMLLFLNGKERTVNEIAEAVGLGQSTASEQLAVLKRAGLLSSKKVGKEVYYRPDKANIQRMLGMLSDFLNRCCD